MNEVLRKQRGWGHTSSDAALTAVSVEERERKQVGKIELHCRPDDIVSQTLGSFGTRMASELS